MAKDCTERKLEGGGMKKKFILLLTVVIIFVLPILLYADEYVLVMSKDDNVCQHMLKVYNDDLKKYGEIKYDKHDEFKSIKWNEKKYYRLNNGKKEYPKPPIETNTTVLLSEYDINNDGKNEIVVRNESYYKNILSDDLYYFKNEDAILFRDDAFDIKVLYTKATGNVSSGGQNTYKLKELPQFLYLGIGDKEAKAYYSLGGYIYINPFFFAGTYYLDVKDEVPTENKGIYSSKFLVILKYTKDNQRKDTCYYLKLSDCSTNKTKRRK